MPHSSYALVMEQDHDTATMKVLVFPGPGNISGNRAFPNARAGEVVIRVTLATIYRRVSANKQDNGNQLVQLREFAPLALPGDVR